MLIKGPDFDITIANGANNSSAVAVKGDFLNLVFPTLTSCTLTVQVSSDGTTYVPLRVGPGFTAAQVATFTGGAAVCDIPVAGFAFVRVHSSAAQGAARTITASFTRAR